jgi:hypothetical protein
MTILKLHYDGWLKLPADLQRVLGAATGDLLEIMPAEGGLMLRTKAAAPASIEAAAVLYQRPRFPTGLACEAFPPPRGDG